MQFKFDVFFKIIVENTEYKKELIEFFIKLNKNM